MPKPVVLIAETLSPATVEALGPDFDIRHCDGTNREQLLAAVENADALLVRSATQVDHEVFAAARQLQVVARAGVGLDNVDVPAATAAGVMVVNAPTSNITSAAELAIGLLLASARHIPAAHSALVAGQWQRSQYSGVELFDKTLGVLGMGRIGALVAARMQAFGMNVVAYDPYISAARAEHLGVKLGSLEQVLRDSDFVTVHLPKTPETVGLIGAQQLAMMKPHARIVNAARGGIVDEQALAQAISSGQIAGAGLDVFSSEPMTSSPLFGLPGVVVTPHLGASTDEAQEKAGVAVARSVRLALAGDLVPDAVNVSGGAIADDLRPVIPLAETLGRLFSGLAASVPSALTVEVRGDWACSGEAKVLELAVLKGLFADVVAETVTYVNAPLLANERGVQVLTQTRNEDDEFRSSLVVRGTTGDGVQTSLTGILAGAGSKQVAKVVDVDGFDVEFVPTEHLAFFRYTDRPGVIGTTGQILGASGINIASMQVSRNAVGGQAFMTMSVDSAIGDQVMAQVSEGIGATTGRAVSLPR